MIRLSLLLLMTTLLSACYYEFDNPVASLDQQEYDSNLLGLWACGKSGKLEIVYDEQSGHLLIKNPKAVTEAQKRKDRMYAISSLIGSNYYLSVLAGKNPNQKKLKYTLVKYKVNGQYLVISLLNKKFSEDLKTGILVNEKGKVTAASNELYNYLYSITADRFTRAFILERLASKDVLPKLKSCDYKKYELMTNSTK